MLLDKNQVGHGEYSTSRDHQRMTAPTYTGSVDSNNTRKIHALIRFMNAMHPGRRIKTAYDAVDVYYPTFFYLCPLNKMLPTVSINRIVCQHGGKLFTNERAVLKKRYPQIPT